MGFLFAYFFFKVKESIDFYQISQKKELVILLFSYW
jgi:hypothetical protein